MLRIKGPAQEAPPPPTLDEQAPPDDPEQVDDPTEETGEEAQTPSKFSIDHVDPAIAGYMGSELGRFECQRCKFWEDPNGCAIVSGNIDPRGCCNLFTPDTVGSQETPPEA